jgi:hypothetical protein
VLSTRDTYIAVGDLNEHIRIMAFDDNEKANSLSVGLGNDAVSAMFLSVRDLFDATRRGWVTIPEELKLILED